MELNKVIQNKKNINKYGARKYGDIMGDSMGHDNQSYTVVKFRKKGTRNYFYSCTCPDHIFRRKTCKHIRKFKELEKGEKN